MNIHNLAICIRTCYITRCYSQVKSEYVAGQVKDLMEEGSLVRFFQKDGVNLVHPHSESNGVLNLCEYLFYYDSTKFRSITEHMWNILITVKKLSMRREYAVLSYFHQFIQKARVGSKIELTGVANGKLHMFWAKIAFFGPVPELGLGSFYGVIFLDPTITVEPLNNLPTKYLSWNPSKSIIGPVSMLLSRIEIIKLNGVDPFLPCGLVDYRTRWETQPKEKFARCDAIKALHMMQVLNFFYNEEPTRKLGTAKSEQVIRVMRRRSLPDILNRAYIQPKLKTPDKSNKNLKQRRSSLMV